jgi:osmotically-inducible protein OsmY
VTHRQLRRVESEAYGVTQKVQHLRPEDEHPSEQRLLARVRSEVFRDPSVPKGQLNVSVDERGTVVLRGHTSDEATRRAIEHRTRSVAGVEHVENLINVAP